MKKTRIGINGFGRIGSLVLRAAEQREDVEVVAINDPFMSPDYMAYMLRYDTVHGKFPGTVDSEEGALIVNGRRIAVFSQMEAKDIPWQSADAEFIMESTGKHLTAELCKGHIEAGARHVVIGAPSKDDTPMFVMGVNHKKYTPDMTYVSNASCTTNCLAPIAKVLQDSFGIKDGLMTTVHSVTPSQKILDGASLKDWRGGRAACGNIIPSSTGAAKAVGRVIPSLKGKMTGMSFRVPTADVSVVDLTARLSRPTSYAEICYEIRHASETNMKGIIGYTKDQLVSTDLIGNPCPCIFDESAGLMLDHDFVKLIAWYDNEWGYSCQVVRMLDHMATIDAEEEAKLADAAK